MRPGSLRHEAGRDGSAKASENHVIRCPPAPLPSALFPSNTPLCALHCGLLGVASASETSLKVGALWPSPVHEGHPKIYRRLTSLPLPSYCSLLLGTPFSAWTESCHPDPGMYDICQTEDHQVQNKASASLQALWVTDFQRFPLHPIRFRYVQIIDTLNFMAWPMPATSCD